MDKTWTSGQDEIIDAGAVKQQRYVLRQHAGRTCLFREVHTVQLTWNLHEVYLQWGYFLIYLNQP